MYYVQVHIQCIRARIRLSASGRCLSRLMIRSIMMTSRCFNFSLSEDRRTLNELKKGCCLCIVRRPSIRLNRFGLNAIQEASDWLLR